VLLTAGTTHDALTAVTDPTVGLEKLDSAA
jgi:hypothetical protein